jgi:hypothetical protein
METLQKNTSAEQFTPHTREEALRDMLVLRWPDYCDQEQRMTLALEKLEATEAIRRDLSPDHDSEAGVTPHTMNEHGYYLPQAASELVETPAERRRMSAEINAQSCQELARLLEQGPFATCNPKVAEAFRRSVDEAVETLLAVYAQEETALESATRKVQYDHKDPFTIDAAFSLQTLSHTLAGMSAVFGALDYQEAFVDYETQTFSGIDRTSRTRNHGRSNSYRTTYLGVMEWPEDDESQQDVESPTHLRITAIPEKRLSFELDFLSHNLAERFATTAQKAGHSYDSSNFSVRLDYDEHSPHGLSFDLGRDDRDSASYSRNSDATGRSLQSARPDSGSHFTDAFAHVTSDDMEEFIAGVLDFLETDAAMARYDETLRAPGTVTHRH